MMCKKVGKDLLRGCWETGWYGRGSLKEFWTYDAELLVRLLHIHIHILDVVVNPIEHRALVYHHRLQLFENIGQLNNSRGDVIDFALSLRDRCVIGVQVSMFQRGGLLEGRLGESFVGLGFHHAGVGVGVLSRNGG